MKILKSPLAILAALWCVAVLLVPVALAQESGPGGMSGFGSSGSDTGIMAQPPSGGSGNSMGPGGSGNSQGGSPPSGGSGDSPARGGPGTGMGAGNTTMKEPPTGDFGNMTRTGGPGSGMGGGNMTSMDFGNTTRPEFDDRAFGNMTPPEFGNQTFGNMTAPGMHGNSTQMHRGPGNLALTNATPRSDGQGNEPGGQTQPTSYGVPSATQAQQQSKEDVIASLISQLQALLSGKK